jgi:predicted nucleic-acid-binding protein
MRQKFAVDASVIVRYLTGDEKTQSPAATELFKAAEQGLISLVIPTSAIMETVYVLESVYGHEAAAIAPKLVSLLSIPNVENPDTSWLMEALASYRSKNSDFGDAMLCAFARQRQCGVVTFDKGLIKKFSEVVAVTPADCPREPNS